VNPVTRPMNQARTRMTVIVQSMKHHLRFQIR
jgi:hypothetical protein